MRPSWLLCPLLWAATLSLFAQGFSPAGSWSGEFGAGLEDEERLAMLLRLEAGGIEGRLALGASAGGLSLASSLDASGPGRPGGGSRLLAGPGFPSGPLYVLAAPTAYSSGLSARGFPLRLDPSLAASSSVLGLGVGLGLGRQEGSLSLFAAASGLEGGFLFAREGFAGGGEGSRAEPPGLPEALALGSVFCLGPSVRGRPSPEGSGISLVTALSLRRGKEGGGGWEPETRDLPADFGAFAALAGERRSREGAFRWAWAAEVYPHEAPAFAFRLEAEESSGRLFTRARAGAAGEGFRLLLGPLPARLAGLALDFRLALRRAAAATLSLRAEAGSAEALRAASPVFAPSLALGFELPLGVEGLSARPLLELEWGEPSACALSLGLKWARGRLSSSGKAGLELRADGNEAAGPSLDGTASADFIFRPESGREPSVDCRISLKAKGLAAGAPAAPAADASLKLEWGLAHSGRLSLGVAMEDAALLVPVAGDASGGVQAKVSAAYRVCLGGRP